MDITIIAIIPARGGSKGLPGKNLQKLGEVTLLEHTINDAKECKLIDQIYVSTDDAEIARVATRADVSVIMRPADLAQDDTTTEATLQHAVKPFTGIKGIVYLSCCDIFRKRWYIDRCVSDFIDHYPKYDSVFIGTSTKKNYWRKINGTFERLAPGIKQGSRQTKEPLYREDTGLCCVTKPEFIAQGKRIGDSVKIVANHDDSHLFDIHSAEDLKEANRWITGKNF